MLFNLNVFWNEYPSSHDPEEGMCTLMHLPKILAMFKRYLLSATQFWRIVPVTFYFICPYFGYPKYILAHIVQRGVSIDF